jgi:hypothetical protein
VLLTVTLDTNTIDHRGRVESACAGLDVELAYTTVTDRETEGTSRATSGGSVVETGVWNESRWDEFIWGGSVPETGVYDESRYDSGAVYGSDETASILESILVVIGGGSFPPTDKRATLTAGERHQLRDAMILEAHAREGRDVFLSEDTKAFVNSGRRELLEQLCNTRIMTVDEFCNGVEDLAS